MTHQTEDFEDVEVKEVEGVSEEEAIIEENKNRQAFLNKMSTDAYGLEASTAFIAIKSHSGKYRVDFFGDNINLIELYGLREALSREIDRITKGI